ncbi:UDP-glucuronosyltransferase 3A1-like [Bolinopsis microptera]|uniref:UDP-glucuronosyltransferase 3A1-like n=1 Tax=Bolinopsis microptera TaxID=2820187 RepID=UPI003079BABF
MRVFLVVALLLQASRGWEVLVANVLSTGSHQTVSAYLTNLLIDRGHSVTYVSTNIPGYLREGVDKRELPTCTKAMNQNDPRNSGGGENEGLVAGVKKVLGAIDSLLRSCERWYDEPNVQEILRSNKKYDVMITFGLFDTCSLGLASHLGINNTIIHSSFPALMPNHIQMLGLPLYSSSVDINDILIRDSELVKSSITARAKNLLKRVVFGLLYTTLTNWYIEPVIKQHVPDYQGYNRAYKSVKLVTMRSHPHPQVDGPTPYGPGVLTLGGSLCKAYNPADIAAHLMEYVDSASEGFIYISFGSVQKDSPPEEQAKWIETFEDLPYKVVWKQSKQVENLPDNIRVFPWVAQMALLQHPNIKLFITHGGYASKMEAICSGVPQLVVPKFASDQYYTAERIASLGLGEQIPDLDNTTAPEIRSKIYQITGSGGYYEKMADVKRQLLLTRVTDLQVLGYVDAVVNGHSFLPGYQPWYQYYYLDIIFIPILTILVIRFIYKRVFSKSE